MAILSVQREKRKRSRLSKKRDNPTNQRSQKKQKTERKDGGGVFRGEKEEVGAVGDAS